MSEAESAVLAGQGQSLGQLLRGDRRFVLIHDCLRKLASVASNPLKLEKDVNLPLMR